jgi:hypothetical protein
VANREGDLLFSWEYYRSHGATLIGFLVASLLLHAVCFYVFQIIYPPAIALLPPPGRITVISPNNPAGRVLMNWLEAEDPALASTTLPPRSATLSLPTVQHAPSYLGYQPSLKEVPQTALDPGIPAAGLQLLSSRCERLAELRMRLYGQASSFRLSSRS